MANFKKLIGNALNKAMTKDKVRTSVKQECPKGKCGTYPDCYDCGGTYFAFQNGRVGRTYSGGPYESMDTTGYSKGKKEFTLNKSYSGQKTLSEKVQRKDVPSTISNFKKGATRTEIYKKKG